MHLLAVNMAGVGTFRGLWCACGCGKMSKDIGMGVHKGTVVSFVPTLFGCFLGIFHPYVSLHFFKCFFVTCFSFFFGGGGVHGYRAIDPQYGSRTVDNTPSIITGVWYSKVELEITTKAGPELARTCKASRPC